MVLRVDVKKPQLIPDRLSPEIFIPCPRNLTPIGICGSIDKVRKVGLGQDYCMPHLNEYSEAKYNAGYAAPRGLNKRGR